MSEKYPKGNNMPIQAPLIPDPFVPYHCKDNVMGYVICRGEESRIRALLEPSLFDYASDLYMVEISDFTNTDVTSFMDAAIVLPVRYKNILGGCYLFEYEDNDRAIAAGRDLWGYPKKYANIELRQENDIIYGKASRHGTTSCSFVLHTSDLLNNVPELKLTPHLNMHVLPRSDGPGTFMTRVIARDTSPDFVLKSKITCRAEIELVSTAEDPWGALGLVEVLGGGVLRGDFHATEENGWGKVLDIYQ